MLFQALKHMFQALKQLLQALKYKFQGLKQKISRVWETFLRRDSKICTSFILEIPVIFILSVSHNFTFKKCSPVPSDSKMLRTANIF